MLKNPLLNVKSYFVLKLKNLILILNFHLQIYFQQLCMNRNQFSITWYPSAATITIDQSKNTHLARCAWWLKTHWEMIHSQRSRLCKNLQIEFSKFWTKFSRKGGFQDFPKKGRELPREGPNKKWGATYR